MARGALAMNYDGETEHVVSSGDTVIVQADQPHAFTNSGTERLRQIDVHLSPRFRTEWLDDDNHAPASK
ncbi:MAG: cupin domain-containing protein [Gaiellaceae bacterium]